MGRIAGVTADETRERVLEGAAAVFARRGYDGASMAALAEAAGVSSGAIYSHFGSKAELFVATLRSHGSVELEALLALGPTGADALRTITERGVALAHRDRREGSLLVEAIVAAKRHPEVAELLASGIAEREGRFAALFVAGQADGTLGPGVRPGAMARFVLMLVLGSLLASAMDLPPVDDDDWAHLIDDLVGLFRQPDT